MLVIKLFVFLSCTIASSHQAIGGPLAWRELSGDEWEEAMLLYNRTIASQFTPGGEELNSYHKLLRIYNIRRKVVTGTIYEFKAAYMIRNVSPMYCHITIYIQPWEWTNRVVEFNFLCKEHLRDAPTRHINDTPLFA